MAAAWVITLPVIPPFFFSWKIHFFVVVVAVIQLRRLPTPSLYYLFSTKILFRLTAGRWDINEHTDTLGRVRVMRSAAVFFCFVFKFIFSVNSFVFCTFQQLRATLNINAEHVQRLLEQNRCALDVHLCANFSFSFKTRKHVRRKWHYI